MDIIGSEKVQKKENINTNKFIDWCNCEMKVYDTKDSFSLGRCLNE